MNFRGPKGLKKKDFVGGLILVIGVLLFINLMILGYFLFISVPPKTELRVIFFDIGQGDAILIQTPEQQNILVDGGPDKSIIYKLDKYIPITRRTIDLMIATHADLDHITGLAEVLRRYSVKKVLDNGLQSYTPVYNQWQKLIQEQNTLRDIVNASETITLESGVLLEFLWPDQDLIKESQADDNFASVIIKLIYGNNSFLLTGDASIEAEEILMGVTSDPVRSPLSKESDKNHRFFTSDGLNLKVDVLKIGHHGSKYSSDLEFLKLVNPKYGVISVGENNFGHPSLRVIKNLENIGAEILRTDELGDIIFISDGKKLSLTSRN